MARQTKEIKKYVATRRAQLRLKQQFERIDFDEDVLVPEVEELMSGKVKLEIGPGDVDSVIGLVIDEEDEEFGDNE